MVFLAVLLALGGVQLWGVHNPFQRDAGFYGLLARLPQAPWSRLHRLAAALGVLLPVVGLATLDGYIRENYWWLWLPLSAVVLLYSFGRGEYAALIADYIEACRAEQWTAAAVAAKALGGDVATVPPGDWPALHAIVLAQAGYQGFERVFAVLFWFVLAGPAGAVLYRLSRLLAASRPEPALRRWLWLLEWPAARALGFSFAFTGNFVGCFQRWQRYIGCLNSSTVFVITQSVLGALAVTEDTAQTCAVTRRELMAMQRLLSRTLWFWLATLALFTLRG